MKNYIIIKNDYYSGLWDLVLQNNGQFTGGNADVDPKLFAKEEVESAIGSLPQSEHFEYRIERCFHPEMKECAK